MARRGPRRRAPFFSLCSPSLCCSSLFFSRKFAPCSPLFSSFFKRHFPSSFVQTIRQRKRTSSSVTGAMLSNRGALAPPPPPAQSPPPPLPIRSTCPSPAAAPPAPPAAPSTSIAAIVLISGDIQKDRSASELEREEKTGALFFLFFLFDDDVELVVDRASSPLGEREQRNPARPPL